MRPCPVEETGSLIDGIMKEAIRGEGTEEAGDRFTAFIIWSRAR